jgi:hypothetical protein
MKSNTTTLQRELEEIQELDYGIYLHAIDEALYKWQERQSNLFFVGLNPRWQMYKFLPQGLNVMYSAYGFYEDDASKRIDRFWRRGKYKKEFGLRWLDSGGFSMLNKYGLFPFTPENYINLVGMLKPHFYAGMDYPCEPEITRLSKLETDKERIHATVDFAIELDDLTVYNPDSVFVPVIQGYSVDDYKYCIDLYKANGLIKDYMAVGSMCKRRNTPAIVDLITDVSNYAKDAGCDKLHYFGLIITKRIEDLNGFIFSRDSANTMDCSDKEIRAAMDGRRYPRGQNEKKIVFESFLDRLTNYSSEYELAFLDEFHGIPSFEDLQSHYKEIKENLLCQDISFCI